MRLSSTASQVGPRVVAIVLALVLTTAVATSHAQCWDCLNEHRFPTDSVKPGICCRSGSYSGLCQHRANSGRWYQYFSNKNECSAAGALEGCEGLDSGDCTPNIGGGNQGFWEPDQGCVYDHTGFCSPECGSCIWPAGPDWL